MTDWWSEVNAQENGGVEGSILLNFMCIGSKKKKNGYSTADKAAPFLFIHSDLKQQQQAATISWRVKSKSFLEFHFFVLYYFVY